jgi:dienelactone hydrolase
MFGASTEAGVGKWLHVGSAGNRAYLSPPERGTDHINPGTGHWLVEPNHPDAYNAAAAALVWERTLAFLKARLP